ncbi:MAG: PP2C family protein-serine/threonine phosphatase [Phycisphaerales bacterium]|nr:PP2C family protein-serine/threonine phosphatase [Phycisphaerales bacterium]
MGLRIARSSSSGPKILVASSAPPSSEQQPDPLLSSVAVELAKRGIALEHISIDQLLKSEPKSSSAQTPVLVLLSEHDSDSTINQLADLLIDHLTPALVLTPPTHTHATMMLRAQGIMCESLDIDPVHASIILWTLAQRQPAIQQLSTDLRITEMSVNSVHTEINKLHEELATAACIQREYMPKELPKIDGLDMGIVYRPASYVSGDIYDVIELDEHHTGFFLADAVGHGVPAALMTMVITQGLHKIEGKGDKAHIIPPGEALRRLNNTMTEHQGEQARFATAVYAIHNKLTNEITVAGAGHPPSLLVRSETGDVEHLESDGPLLGVFPDVEFGQETITLEPGDVFIMYSDGFEVAFPNKDAVGDDRKRPTLTYLTELADAGSGIETLGDAIATLESHLDNQIGSLHQPDDITALFLASVGSLSSTES